MDTVIQFRNTIYENGYGLIAQKVMRDPDISPAAKSIYAYICSFAGTGKNGERAAFPGVKLMKEELGIKTDAAYYKHRKQLIQKGYITIEKQRKEGQKFDNNLYFIEAMPIEKEKKQPHSENRSKEPYFDLPSTEKRSLENRSTIINSFNINRFKKEEDNKENPFFRELEKFLQEKNVKQNTIKKTIRALKDNDVHEFSMGDVIKQFNHTIEKSKVQRIYDFPKYFVNGLTSLSEIKGSSNTIKKIEGEKRDTSFYYNWLKESN